MNTNGWTTVTAPRRFGNTRECVCNHSACTGMCRRFGKGATADAAPASTSFSAFRGSGRWGDIKHTAVIQAEEERRRVQREADRKKADAANFSSHESYPSLGGGSVAPQPKAVMNFKQAASTIVEEPAARSTYAAPCHAPKKPRSSPMSIPSTPYPHQSRGAPHVFRNYEYEDDGASYNSDPEDAPKSDSEGEWVEERGSSRRRGGEIW